MKVYVVSGGADRNVRVINRLRERLPWRSVKGTNALCTRNATEGVP